MLKAKLPLIILLILLVVSGVITFRFYSDNQNLIGEKQDLDKEKAGLSEENDSLRSKYRDLGTRYTTNKKRLNDIQDELSKVSGERDDLKSRYDAVYKEREQLVFRVKELMENNKAVIKKSGLKSAQPASESYWSDVIKKKAELQVRLENFQRQLFDIKAEVSHLQKNNKELSLKIDEITKDRDRLQTELSFKEQAMDIMSRDLVNEREARNNFANKMGELRDDNMSLKRELIVANRDKIKLQDKLKDTFNKRDELEKRVGDIKSLLKNKKMMFSELENQLTEAVSGKVAAKEDSASVELSPIVVKADSMEGKSSLKGEVLAVNKNDNFVIIDLGEDAGVKPGLKFNIVRSGGTIGNVEVIETRREISAADIKEVNSGYTIHEGDTVIAR